MTIAGMLPAFVGDWGDQARYTAPSAPLVDPAPFIREADFGVLPEGYDWSRVQAVELGMVTIGIGTSISLDARLADDFVIPVGETWQLTAVTFYMYVTDTSTFCTINDARIWIYDGEPPDGNLLWGDADTNRFESGTFSGIYRATDDPVQMPLELMRRPVMAVRCVVDVELSGGTYWIAWATGGGTASVQYSIPIVIDGEPETGNCKQYFFNEWYYFEDSGTGSMQGAPILIEGFKTGGGGDPIVVAVPYPVDSVATSLEGDALIVAESDEYSVTVDSEDIAAEIATDLDADLEGETTVDREC